MAAPSSDAGMLQLKNGSAKILLDCEDLPTERRRMQVEKTRDCRKTSRLGNGQKYFRLVISMSIFTSSKPCHPHTGL
jgi:hypothetical protein